MIVALACSTDVVSANDSPVNVVLIVADDLGYGELGCYGGRGVPTPHIDSLADDGVRMTNGYVSCPVCSPTRAGLLTGRYQQRFGHEFNPGSAREAGDWPGLAKTERTLAELLQAAGYKTGMVGKWHLGYLPGSQPLDRGFQEHFGFLAGAHAYLANAVRPNEDPILRGRETIGQVDDLTQAFGREAASFIDRHKDDPFFLYVPFNAVHAPLQATEESRRRVGSVSDPRRQTFLAMLGSLDDAVGAILEKLHEHHLDERTLVFFVSDNGGPTPSTTSSNGPLSGFKGSVSEGGIRVPFLIRWTDRLPSGKVYDQPVISLDVVSTVLSAAGITAPPERPLDGVNLVPYLMGSTGDPPHRALYWRFGPEEAIRKGDFKWVRHRGQVEPMLFNLASDIGEKTDLSGEMPEIMADLAADYAKWSAAMMEPRIIKQSQPGRVDRSKRTVAQRFAQGDKNGDGKLTPDEVKSDEKFLLWDADRDGTVTLEEFRGRRSGDR